MLVVIEKISLSVKVFVEPGTLTALDTLDVMETQTCDGETLSSFFLSFFLFYCENWSNLLKFFHSILILSLPGTQTFPPFCVSDTLSPERCMR